MKDSLELIIVVQKIRNRIFNRISFGTVSTKLNHCVCTNEAAETERMKSKIMSFVKEEQNGAVHCASSFESCDYNASRLDPR